MSALLEALNRLLGEALAGQAPGGAVQVRSVLLDAQGARIVAQVRAPVGEGELVLRLQAAPPEGDRQSLVLTLERAPEHWAPVLEPFRRVLERARLRLELDFSEPAPAGSADALSPSPP